MTKRLAVVVIRSDGQHDSRRVWKQYSESAVHGDGHGVSVQGRPVVERYRAANDGDRRAAGSITIPADLTGQNAKIAEDKLKALGLTNVTLSSANPKYTMVLLPENWTVVSIEPAPGTTVSAADPVVVKVTKP